MTDMIRIVIADDHPLVRQGIRTTIERAGDMDVVGEAARGDEAQRLCQALLPDVLLLDLQMPGATAIETVTALHEHCPTMRVIILTAYDDAVYIQCMMRLAVAGYVLKDEMTGALLTAVRSVMQGGTWLSRRVLGTLAEGRIEAQAQDAAAIGRRRSVQNGYGERVTISEREQVMLQRLAEGLTQERIAQVEHLSVRTVKRTVASLEAKLDVSCQFVLAMRAVQLGLIDGQ